MASSCFTPRSVKPTIVAGYFAGVASRPADASVMITAAPTFASINSRMLNGVRSTVTRR